VKQAAIIHFPYTGAEGIGVSRQQFPFRLPGDVNPVRLGIGLRIGIIKYRLESNKSRFLIF